MASVPELPDRPTWTEEFQREILRSACESDWPTSQPGLFHAGLFGPLGGRVTGLSPRVRIARGLEAYWNKYDLPPGLSAVRQLIERELAPLQPAERQPVLDEWERIVALPAPSNEAFLIDTARDWARWKVLADALIAAGDRLRSGPDGLDEATEAVNQGLDSLLSFSPTAEAATESRFVAEHLDRLRYWEQPNLDGEHIATGFGPLDSALNGGPMRGESFYVLAPPKGAKTTVLVNVALAALRQRLGVYFVSFEMRAQRVLRRADRGLARATPQELEADPQRLLRAMRSLQAVSRGELWVKESSPLRPRAVEETFDRVQRLRNEGHSVDVVIFDYLNIMGSARQEREKRHELARTSREISQLAKELDVLTWSAALVNRQAVNKLNPSKTDIAEAFEVLAVLDGAVAIFADRRWREQKLRGLFATAFREAEDDRICGVYRVDLGRLQFSPLAPDAQSRAFQREEQPEPESTAQESPA